MTLIYYPPTQNGLQKSLNAQLNTGETSSMTLNNTTGVQDKAGVVLLARVDSGGSELDPSLREFVIYTGTSGNTLTGLVRGIGGSTDQDHAIGTIVEFVNDITWAQGIIDFLLAEHNESDGTHKSSLVTTLKASGAEVNTGTSDLKIVTPKAIADSDLAYLSDITVDEDSTNTFTNKTMDFNNNTFTNFPTSSTDGWTTVSDTWTYASASTFTIAGVDRTSVYTAGTRLKFTQTTTKYAVVVSSSFSTNTTVTIAVNTDYTIANAAITSPYYSYQAKPQGYPSFFNYTPTYAGFSANPTTGTAFFSVNGGICHVFHTESAAGTSNATSFTITTPFPPNASVATNGVSGLGQGTDNGSNLTSTISIYCTGGSTTLTLFKDVGGTAWTNTGNKRATNISIFYPI